MKKNPMNLLPDLSQTAFAETTVLQALEHKLCFNHLLKMNEKDLSSTDAGAREWGTREDVGESGEKDAIKHRM